MKRNFGRDRWFVVPLTLALTLGVVYQAAATVVDNRPTAVTFTETMNTLWLNTEALGRVGSPDPFRVNKFITNNTPFSNHGWTDFHIVLEVDLGSGWQPSLDNDGISFNQPQNAADWANNVAVDIDNLIIDPSHWDVVRQDVPTDEIWFTFNDFKVMPGQQLSLHFDMIDFGGTGQWRLAQHASIPEPATLALLGLGLAGIGLRRRRRVAA